MKKLCQTWTSKSPKLNPPKVQKMKNLHHEQRRERPARNINARWILFCSKSCVDPNFSSHFQTCLKLFEKPSKLVRHEQTHDVNKKPFACEELGCFQRFLTDASLKRHAILHSGMTIKVQEEKTYECVVCSKQFQMQEALASHMRTHKDVMSQLEFPCSLCDQVFKKLNDLTRHSRKHPENKSHKCLICSKMFSQGSHLIDHLNRHNNLRPHVCHVCNKGKCVVQTASRN